MEGRLVFLLAFYCFNVAFCVAKPPPYAVTLKSLDDSSSNNRGCRNSCTDFISKNGYGQCKKKQRYTRLPICYVERNSPCSDKRQSKTDPDKFYSTMACMKEALPTNPEAVRDANKKMSDERDTNRKISGLTK